MFLEVKSTLLGGLGMPHFVMELWADKNCIERGRMVFRPNIAYSISWSAARPHDRATKYGWVWFGPIQFSSHIEIWINTIQSMLFGPILIFKKFMKLVGPILTDLETVFNFFGFGPNF